MASWLLARRGLASVELASSSGRSLNERRSSAAPHAFCPAPCPRLTRPASTAPLLRALGAPDGTRPPAGPSTVLCSSLRKERKKLSKALKSHRKVLEKRLSAVTTAEADAPVLAELLSELRTLSSRLDSQRLATMLYADDGSDSSDSDDECDARSAAALAHARRAAAAATSTAPLPAAPPAAGISPASSTMVVSGRLGQLELAVPAPQEGWDWSEDDFHAAKFEGSGGRVMVCTGSKCQRKGATEVLRAVCALSEGNPGIKVVPCKCVGKCSAGAAMRVRPAGAACATYTEVRPAQLPAVFEAHFAAPADAAAAEAARVNCCVECQLPGHDHGHAHAAHAHAHTV